MQVDGGADPSVGTDPHRDAVGDLEALRLALFVEESDHVAGDALGAQIVVERSVDGDGEPAFLGERELFVGRGADVDVVGFEAERGAVAERQVVPPVVARRRGAPQCAVGLRERVP